MKEIKTKHLMSVKHEGGETKHRVYNKGAELKTSNRDLKFALGKPGLETWKKSLAEHNKERIAKHKSSRGKVKSKMK